MGQIEITALSESKRIVVTNDDTSRDYILPKGAEILVDEDQVTAGIQLSVLSMVLTMVQVQR